MDDLQDPSAITDDTATDTPPDTTTDLPSSPAFPIPSPSASPPSFWDRSTWDPNSLGAMLEGQPVPPYRTQGQVQADAWDALVTGPTHPGWSEPITRRAIDDITTSMAQNRMPDGPFADSLRLLAAQPNADPDLQAWAASDAAVRAGQHPFQPLWDLNAAAQAPGQNPVSGNTIGNADDGNVDSQSSSQPASGDGQTAITPQPPIMDIPEIAANRPLQSPGDLSISIPDFGVSTDDAVAPRRIVSPTDIAGLTGTPQVLDGAGETISQASDGTITVTARRNNPATTQNANYLQLAKILQGGEGGYDSYNTGTRGMPNNRVGHSYNGAPDGVVPVTKQTINQILSTDPLSPTDSRRMFAVGAYQITIPTLRDAVNAMHLTGNELLDQNMQDRIYRDFLVPHAGDGALSNLMKYGTGTVDQAQYAAARKWASVAVPQGSKTKSGSISDGTMSYYPPPANAANPNTTAALRTFLGTLNR